MTKIITLIGYILLEQAKLSGDVLLVNDKTNQVIQVVTTNKTGQFMCSFPDSILNNIVIYYNIKDTIKHTYLLGKGIYINQYIKYSSNEKHVYDPFILKNNEWDTIQLNINITEKFVPIYLKTNVLQATDIYIVYPNNCFPLNELVRLSAFSVDAFDFKIGAKIRLKPNIYNIIWVPQHSEFNHYSSYHFFYRIDECYMEKPRWATNGYLQEVIIDNTSHIYMTSSFEGYNYQMFSVFPMGYAIVDLIFRAEPPLTEINWNRMGNYIDKRNAYMYKVIDKKDRPQINNIYPKRKKMLHYFSPQTSG